MPPFDRTSTGTDRMPTGRRPDGDRAATLADGTRTKSQYSPVLAQQANDERRKKTGG